MTDLAARTWGVLFARCIVGLMFLMAGVFKVFDMGPLEHARQLFLPYQDTFLPVWTLWATGVAIPFVELIAGGLLVIGFRTRWAACALGFVLITVTFGHLLSSPLYAFHEHVVPRLLFVLVVLFTPQGWDRYSTDGWLRQRKASSNETAKDA